MTHPRDAEIREAPARLAPNSTAAAIGRAIAAAQAHALTIYRIRVSGSSFELVTQPVAESAGDEDAADRWLREQADAGKAGRRA